MLIVLCLFTGTAPSKNSIDHRWTTLLIEEHHKTFQLIIPLQQSGKYNATKRVTLKRALRFSVTSFLSTPNGIKTFN